MTTSAEIPKNDISVAVCGYSKVIEIISNKWTALIIYALENGRIRYGEMERRIESISKKMLTQTLRKLERNGLIQRHITPTVPPSVDYFLTPLGESLLQPMKELRQWGRENYLHVEAARAHYDQSYSKEPQSPEQ
ncbi:helix-turn-helix domain-containing protein [Cohnella sp. REN36]|uniref:winged helix-turn-helix transcriptional regulator n=1 Tax=Cohnella sp. REN36 TaxID=2887347 RepID=UPI001D138875|nr:helix-turn-helix domain-containing protein [Cohnella sp. REN36]MCC3374153.1 helix-turn-helix transcriptional regulator [Cohnella sp. REN36]